VAALLMLGLIFAFGAASARQQAWMQGYMMGQMAADGGSQSVAPLMPYLAYGGGHMGWGGGFGSPFLFFGGILLVFLGLRFIFGGPGRRHGWSKHGEATGQHGWPCPLWWSQQPPASSEETPESQPESEA
jgi:hypothetical protein